MKRSKKYFYSIVMITILSTFVSCLRAKRSSFDFNSPTGSFFAFAFSSALTPPPPPTKKLNSIEYENKTLTRTQPMATLEPEVNGTALSYSVDKTLPPGLSIDTNNGFISGTPTVDQAEKIYKVTALNGSESASTDLKIKITSDAPTNLVYNGIASGLQAGSTPASILIRRTVAASIKPTILGTASFSIAPSLPTGLTFNATNGTISGTVTNVPVSPLTTHTITATNVFGSIQINVSITILPVIYLATFGGGLAISLDGGNTFTMRNVASNGIGCNQLNALTVDNAGNIFVANNSNMCPGGISVSSNNGNSFTFLSATNGFQGRTILSETTGTIFFGTAGGFYYSTNSGSTFTHLNTALNFESAYINDIFISGSIIYAANGLSVSGGLSYSINGGGSFLKFTNLATNIPVNGVVTAGSNVYVTTSAGNPDGFFMSLNSGTNFNSIGSLPSSWKVAYHNSTIYVASLSTGVYISTNNGTTFTQRTTANSGLPNNAVNAIRVYSDGTIYAGTGGAGLGISTNGGTSFVIRNGTHGISNLSIQGIVVK